MTTLKAEQGRFSLYGAPSQYDSYHLSSNGVEGPHMDVLPEDEHHLHSEMTLNDLFIKDAYLVFRALCKLTMKPLNTERSVVSVRKGPPSLLIFPLQ